MILLLLFLVLFLFNSNYSYFTLKNKNYCIGKRDGVSGCRDCCKNIEVNKYSNCVNTCMSFKN